MQSGLTLYGSRGSSSAEEGSNMAWWCADAEEGSNMVWWCADAPAHAPTGGSSQPTCRHGHDSRGAHSSPPLDVERGIWWHNNFGAFGGGDKNRTHFICGHYARQKGILKLSGQLSGAPDSIPEGPENGCPDNSSSIHNQHSSHFGFSKFYTLQICLCIT